MSAPMLKAAGLWAKTSERGNSYLVGRWGGGRMMSAASSATALAVATELGLPVFPCAGDKRPMCPRGFKDAVRDPDAIRALWRRHPGELVGVATGAVSGVDVLDVDPRHGGDCWLSAHRDWLPATRTHRTRSGGWHFLFACDGRLRNSTGKIAPGVDVRGSGGCCIWWPAAGLAIENANTLALWPTWLLTALLPRPRPRVMPAPIAVPDRYVRAAVARGCDRIRFAPEGVRNCTLNAEAFSLARFIADGAIGERDLVGALADAAAAAGLPAREIAGTLASALGARGWA